MKECTEIVTILDMSGSMSFTRSDAFGGINSFIEEQKNFQGEANFTLLLFDTEVKTIYNGKNIKEVEILEESQYVPRGMTALLDAIGIAIDDVGKRLALLEEEERPNKVIFAILTDGEENSSRKYNHSQLAEMIKRQQEIYNWEFIYLAANQDAFSTAQSYNFKMSNTSNYTSNSIGTQAVYHSASTTVTNYRSTGNATIVPDLGE